MDGVRVCEVKKKKGYLLFSSSSWDRSFSSSKSGIEGMAVFSETPVDERWVTPTRKNGKRRSVRFRAEDRVKDL